MLRHIHTIGPDQIAAEQALALLSDTMLIGQDRRRLFTGRRSRGMTRRVEQLLHRFDNPRQVSADRRRHRVEPVRARQEILHLARRQHVLDANRQNGNSERRGALDLVQDVRRGVRVV